MLHCILAAVFAVSGVTRAAAIPETFPTTTPRYYLTIYAGQSFPFQPRTAHTWGTFTRVGTTPEGNPTLDTFTISWLPADGKVKPLCLKSVPGKNYSHEETLAIQAANNGRVSYWGPYEIDESRYLKALAQKEFLESGEARYRVLDSFNMNRRIVNCVHALTHADPVIQNRIQPVLRVGETGTSRLVSLYAKAGAFLGPPLREPWLLGSAGAYLYPATPREPGESIARRGISPTPAMLSEVVVESPPRRARDSSSIHSATLGESPSRSSRSRSQPVVAPETSFIVR